MPTRLPVRLTLALCALLAVSVTACSTIEERRKIDYRTTRVLPPLEVPPDLSTLPEREVPGQTAGRSGSATYSDYVGDRGTQQASAGQTAVLPQFPDIRLARDGQIRYLVVRADPQGLWNRVREFVLANGLLVAEESPAAGVIETEWAENRANVGTGTQRLISKYLGGLYSTGLRDKYRLRLERGVQPGTTEIYLSHQGMEEVVIENQSDTGPTGSYWRPRATDPELEAEMLQRLAAHLGGEQAATRVASTPQPKPASASEATPASSTTRLIRNGEGAPVLSLADSLDRAWRRVGLSLDRIGFTVEDRDRSNGIYYVRYIDPEQQTKKKGFFSRMFSDDEPAERNQYQVHLKPSDDGTQVEVLGKDGAPEKSKTGERILNLLYEQLS
ncbi:lipoprotein [Sulfurifustis variabilis]|uniref:Lipoprotein n=1 Tax=Sulfurifustis variabilis TaxID=1675686 RepID=A0A1B4V7J8_9GAMM|nr:outer membrane protein assembly factor BamC [Sulfurifustis variabilis]BAU49503.1 lipoprotein [Sulfurifustis variabilis]